MIKTIVNFIRYSFSPVLTILGIYFASFKIIPEYYGNIPDKFIYGILALVVISIVLLVQNLYMLYEVKTKYCYIAFIKELNIGFSAIHSLNHDLSDNIQLVNEVEVESSLQVLCDHLADGFKEVKKLNVSVCIKIISIENVDSASAITLCRDKVTNDKGDRPSKKEDKDEHKIEDNTDFKTLKIYKESNTDAKNKFYLNNFLPFDESYKNSRLIKFSQWPPYNIPILKYIIRHNLWPLKYRSTLVVPILPYRQVIHGDSKLQGFLCIDSPSYMAFNEHYDVEILKGVSDAIYSKISILHQKSTHYGR